MEPIALFSFITNSLLVIFRDLSTNTPTEWTWDFGDESPESNLQNPEHLYTTSGTYNVTLTVTNDDGESTYVLEVIVNGANSITTDAIIDFELPPSIALDPNIKNYLLVKWRKYLQVAFEISDEYLMDDSHYSQLQSMLIAHLVVYDTLIMEAKKYMAAAVNGGGEEGGGGNLKKLETGPSNAEWYSASETLKGLFAKTAEGISPFDMLTQSVCQLASRLGVQLPMCKNLPYNPFIPTRWDGTKYLNTWHFINPTL